MKISKFPLENLLCTPALSNYRDYTQQELARKGILSKTDSEQIPSFETIFGEDNEEYESDDLIEEIPEDEVVFYAKSSESDNHPRIF